MRKYLRRLLPLTMLVILLIPLNVFGASTSTVVDINPYPLPFGSGFGYNGTCPVNEIITSANAWDNRATGWGDARWVICPYEIDTSGNITQWIFLQNDSNFVNRSDDQFSIGDYIGYGAFIIVICDANGNFISGHYSDSYRLNISADDFTANLQNNTWQMYVNKPIRMYPVATNNYNDFLINSRLFTTDIPEIPTFSGHTKAGVLENYIDSTDSLENNSELPTIDTTPPQDTTNNTAWYQKILNGIGKIGLIIKGGVLTIGDYIGQAWEGLKQAIQDGVDKITNLMEQIIEFWGRAIEKIEDIADDLHTISEKITEENTPTEIANAWETGYHSTVFYGMEQNITTARTEFARLGQGGDSSDLILGRWKITHKDNSISIIGQLDLPQIFGGVTTDHEMSFRWYQQIKSWFIPILNAFLVLGFTLHLIRQFPAFINGQGTDLKEKMKK